MPPLIHSHNYIPFIFEPEHVPPLQGWGMVRVENPKLGAGRLVDQMAPWESFQVLGPHSGVDIRDTNSIKRFILFK